VWATTLPDHEPPEAPTSQKRMRNQPSFFLSFFLFLFFLSIFLSCFRARATLPAPASRKLPACLRHTRTPGTPYRGTSLKRNSPHLGLQCHPDAEPPSLRNYLLAPSVRAHPRKLRLTTWFDAAEVASPWRVFHPRVSSVSSAGSRPWTLDPEPWTLNPGPWTLDPEPWTLNPGPWTLDPEP